jgi:dipeptidyl aminopeptidase/acylaminoacyl peptidase
VSNPQISPNGARIVYARQQANKIEDRWDSSLWIMNSDGSQHRFLTKGSNPRWSSDGKRILYIADGEPRGPQIFVRWIDSELSVGVRKSETVALGHPVMPVGDGFCGRVVGINSHQL